MKYVVYCKSSPCGQVSGMIIDDDRKHLSWRWDPPRSTIIGMDINIAYLTMETEKENHLRELLEEYGHSNYRCVLEIREIGDIPKWQPSSTHTHT